MEGWDLGLCLTVATFIPHHCDPTGTDGIWGFAQHWWLPLHPPSGWFDGPNVEGWDLGLCSMVATFIPHHCDPTGIWGFAQRWWLPLHPLQDGLMDPMWKVGIWGFAQRWELDHGSPPLVENPTE